MRAKSLKLCLTLCDPTDCSPPGPSVKGITLQGIKHETLSIMRARERSGDTEFKQRSRSRVMRQIPAPPPSKLGSPTEMPSPSWASISLPGELMVTVHTVHAQQSGSLHLGILLNTPSPEAFSVTLPNPLQPPRSGSLHGTTHHLPGHSTPTYGLSPVSLHWDTHSERMDFVNLLAAGSPVPGAVPGTQKHSTNIC